MGLAKLTGPACLWALKENEMTVNTSFSWAAAIKHTLHSRVSASVVKLAVREPTYGGNELTEVSDKIN